MSDDPTTVSPVLRDASPSAGHNDSSILSEISNGSSIQDGEKHPKGKRKRTAYVWSPSTNRPRRRDRANCG